MVVELALGTYKIYFMPILPINMEVKIIIIISSISETTPFNQ